MVEAIQIIGLGFSAFILYVSFLYYKKRDFTLAEWGFWTLFAAGFAVVSVAPNVIDPVVSTLNFARKLDLFIVLGFMFLIAMVFYNYHMTRHADKRVEELVRNLAIEKAEKK